MFSNLLNNASQAIKDNGLIEISTLMSANNQIMVTIKDNGCGIPKHSISKIFDPYYTTKDYGTGLGLAVVKQIVSPAKGEIRVISDEGQGTT